MDRLCSRIVVLLLTGVLITSTSPEELKVYLEPKYIEVYEGDSVTINCTFQPGENYKLRWYYSPTDLDCNSGTEGLHEKSFNNTENKDTWSIFTINSIKTSESGWYFCKVIKDIPVLLEKCSNGAQVLVGKCQQHPGISKTATDAESNYTRLPHNLLDQCHNNPHNILLTTVQHWSVVDMASVGSWMRSTSCVNCCHMYRDSQSEREHLYEHQTSGIELLEAKPD